MSRWVGYGILMNITMNQWMHGLLAVVLVIGLSPLAGARTAIEEMEADRLFQAVRQNDSAALAKLAESAKRGDARAQDRLGLAYLLGTGVDKDRAVARKWLLRSAAQGYAYAEFRLGFIYEEGMGVATNPAEAVRWYRKSAGHGNIAACYNLGRLYQAGKDVRKNDVQAEKWFRIAAEHGLAVAQLNLGLIYLGSSSKVKQNYQEAFKWLSQAAAAGNAKAIYNVGMMYERGLGVDQNDATALDQYQRRRPPASGGRCTPSAVRIAKESSACHRTPRRPTSGTKNSSQRRSRRTGRSRSRRLGAR